MSVEITNDGPVRIIAINRFEEARNAVDPETAKLNGVDPQAWLTDVLNRIADQKITQLDDLMPWHHTVAAAE